MVWNGESDVNARVIIQRTMLSLVKFVERVAKGGGSPEEMEILPSIAKIILETPIPLNWTWTENKNVGNEE